MAESNDKQIKNWMETEMVEEVFVYAETELVDDYSDEGIVASSQQELIGDFWLDGEKGKIGDQLRILRDIRNEADYDEFFDVNKVSDCKIISEEVLKSFLLRHRAEVKSVILEEFDLNKHIELEKKESYQEGKSIGQRMFAELTQKLLADSRIDDLKRATEDDEFCILLYEEYDIK